MAKTSFTVHELCDIHCTKGKGGRSIEKENIKTFWEDNSTVAQQVGCYVFAIRAGRGMRPWYVGQATASFKQEVFAPDKLNKYDQCLRKIGKGSPIMFFVSYPTKQGATNRKHIDELETFLIQTAHVINKDLRNVHGKKEPMWSITGVTRSGKGKPSNSAVTFRNLFKFKTAK